MPGFYCDHSTIQFTCQLQNSLSFFVQKECPCNGTMFSGPSVKGSSVSTVRFLCYKHYVVSCNNLQTHWLKGTFYDAWLCLFEFLCLKTQNRDQLSSFPCLTGPYLLDMSYMLFNPTNTGNNSLNFPLTTITFDRSRENGLELHNVTWLDLL